MNKLNPLLLLMALLLTRGVHAAAVAIRSQSEPQSLSALRKRNYQQTIPVQQPVIHVPMEPSPMVYRPPLIPEFPLAALRQSRGKYAAYQSPEDRSRALTIPLPPAIAAPQQSKKNYLEVLESPRRKKVRADRAVNPGSTYYSHNNLSGQRYSRPLREVKSNGNLVSHTYHPAPWGQQTVATSLLALEQSGPHGYSEQQPLLKPIPSSVLIEPDTPEPTQEEIDAWLAPGRGRPIPRKPKLFTFSEDHLKLSKWGRLVLMEAEK